MSGSFKSVFGLASFTLGLADLAPQYANAVADSVAFANRFQGAYRFPKNVDSGIFMSFSFVKYQRSSIYDKQATLNSMGSIYLPIPKNLLNTTHVSYTEENLGPAVGGAAAELKSTGGTTLEAAGNYLAGSAAEKGGRIGPEMTNALQSYSGVAINPFQTMLFKTPSFKQHSFNWEFTPENQEESVILKNIIDTIQYHTLPGVSQAAGIFFEYPEMVLIKILPDNNFMYQFKPCVINEFRVNYAPGTSPSFFKNISGTAPTAVSINMSLTETELWTKVDYSGSDPALFNLNDQ